jgi:hypothetical protein
MEEDNYEILAVNPERDTASIMDEDSERHEDIEPTEPWNKHPFQSLIGRGPILK